VCRDCVCGLVGGRVEENVEIKLEVHTPALKRMKVGVNCRFYDHKSGIV
jgi:hypothetical protein